MSALAKADPPGTVPDNSSSAGIVTSFFEHIARFKSPTDSALAYTSQFRDILQPGMRAPQSLTALLFGISTFAGQADRKFSIVSLAFAQASVSIAQKADKLKGIELRNSIGAALTMASMAGMSQPRDEAGQPLEMTRGIVDNLYKPLLTMSTEGGRPLIEVCRTASGMVCIRAGHQQLNYYGHIANRAARALGVMTSGLS